MLTVAAVVVAGFRIRHHVSDLRRIKPELRHRRVPGHNAFRKRLGKILDRIPLVQLSEEWRDTEWTCLNKTNGVALSTVCLSRTRPLCAFGSWPNAGPQIIDDAINASIRRDMRKPRYSRF